MNNGAAAPKGAAVLILAAGGSQRMGGTDKVFAELAGKPVLAHSLITFSRVPEVTGMLVVTAFQNLDSVKDACDEYGIANVLGVIAGGAQRNDSALLGLEELELLGFSGRTVLIHDAARPLVTPEIITAVISAARNADGAIPVVPVNDTIKRVDDNGIVEMTVPRDGLRAVQTPQAFALDYILKLHREVAGNDASITDDAILVEKTGGKVIAVPGSLTNIKITRSVDLEIAEMLLKQRES
ncbi:MAG: 2-C-methyl-D-erythritol 4-phosphate cytidylyltransferase [bacterium]|nr:2-C-methyl-D-erythritol 4-phosphate cytidylyltransferase [bacterium]